MQNSNLYPLKYSDLTECGGCGSNSLFETYNFGKVPIAGHFPLRMEEALPTLPMSLMFCEYCSLVQISPNVDDHHLFSDYRYISSISMKGHFEELASWFHSREYPEKTAKILEIGCNDGPLLECLTKLGYSPTGIDPASNIVAMARKAGLKVINDFFSETTIQSYQDLRELDYIFSANSFAHISDIRSIAKAVAESLSDKGKFIVEVQSLVELVKTNAFDFVYHEHKYYYTIKSISNLMLQVGLHLEHCEMIDTHGGSYRFVFSKDVIQQSSELAALISAEEEMNLNSDAIHEAVGRYVLTLGNFDSYFEDKVIEGKKIVAFGASGRANMLLTHLPRIRNGLPFVIDESPERIGRYMAQNSLPIRAFSSIDTHEFDVVLILAWNFSKSIIDKWPEKVKIEFGVPLPVFEVINYSEDSL